MVDSAAETSHGSYEVTTCVFERVVPNGTAELHVAGRPKPSPSLVAGDWVDRDDPFAARALPRKSAAHRVQHACAAKETRRASGHCYAAPFVAVIAAATNVARKSASCCRRRSSAVSQSSSGMFQRVFRIGLLAVLGLASPSSQRETMPGAGGRPGRHQLIRRAISLAPRFKRRNFRRPAVSNLTINYYCTQTHLSRSTSYCCA